MAPRICSVGLKKERITYDQFTIVQWVFVTPCRGESKMKEHMLDYLISLMDDAMDFSWGGRGGKSQSCSTSVQNGTRRNASL